ncbi:MAG TPA: ribonuclease T2 [Candidatus Acidoferrales bacterium]|nr:ribonuclease T2 [Candidatus Acidoferrales bacterium]
MVAKVARGSILVVVLAALFLAGPAEAKHKKKHHKQASVPGSFDYYVLSLSWSPEHCAEPAGGSDKTQCKSSRKFAFVLHGLWPQFDSGFPQSCSNVALSDKTRDAMLDIMPSPKLIEHEWSKHGTCSGLAPDAYFANARAAFTSVKIPTSYRDPTTAFQTNVGKVEQDFAGANPDLDSSKIAVLCRGKFLQEVRVCLDKDLHPRSCGDDVNDGCGGAIVVRPVK